MTHRLVRLAYRVLRVPLDPPTPPAGFGEVRVIHPSPKARVYALSVWCCAQVIALACVVAILFVDELVYWWRGFVFLKVVAILEAEVLNVLPPAIASLLVLLGITGYVVQTLTTLLATWLRFRTHWYIVGDEGLYIRAGLRHIHEHTIRYANIQHITLKQNLLQRMLRIADVEVQTAGGSSKTDKESGSDGKAHQVGHVGVLRHVDDAGKVRDMIQSRLHMEDSQNVDAVNNDQGQDATSAVLQAAIDLLHETTALRKALSHANPVAADASEGST